MRMPERSLLPPELPAQPVRCYLCCRAPAELLELPFGPVCPACLEQALHREPLDRLAALICAPIITQEIS